MHFTPKQYSNKHLAEIICAFQFPEEKIEWDNTIFGLLYEKISVGFPIKQTRKGVQIKFDTNVQNPIDNKITSSPIEDEMLFQNQDKGWSVLMGREKLSFHITKNYSGFDSFISEFINPILNHYSSLGLGKGNKTCAVVYLNRFENLLGEPFEYFTIINRIENTIGKETNSVLQRTFATNDLNLIAKINCTNTSSGLNVNLECGAISNLSTLDPIDLAFNTRKPIRNFFESIATQKLKDTLI